MKFVFILPGKITDHHIQALLERYSRYLRKYGIVEFRWTKPVKKAVKSAGDIERRVEEEGRHIIHAMENLPRGPRVVFDVKGKAMTSEEFAACLKEMSNVIGPCMVFVIGGPYGLDEEVKRRADVSVSFSRMTLPHELAVVVAVEQVFRAMSIIHGEHYHH